MPEVKPPTSLDSLDWSVPSVFLAGSIEMGAAKDWQRESAARIDPSYLVLNPRRDDWDPSWAQTYENLHFRGQVQWELSGLDRVDHVFVHLVAGTKSPITLMEIGLHARKGKMIVSCDLGFWRRGNVVTLCHHYRVPLYDNIDRAMDEFVRRVGVTA